MTTTDRTPLETPRAADIERAANAWVDEVEFETSDAFMQLHRTVRTGLMAARAAVPNDDAALDAFMKQEAPLEREFLNAITPDVIDAMKAAAVDASTRFAARFDRPDVLAGIRRFYLDDVRATYKLRELAAMWGLTEQDVYDLDDTIEISEQGARPIGDYEFTREWAAIVLASRVASPCILELALGAEAAAVFPPEREMVSILVRVPRWVITTARTEAGRAEKALWRYTTTNAGDGIANFTSAHMDGPEPPPLREVIPVPAEFIIGNIAARTAEETVAFLREGSQTLHDLIEACRPDLAVPNYRTPAEEQANEKKTRALLVKQVAFRNEILDGIAPRIMAAIAALIAEAAAAKVPA